MRELNPPLIANTKFLNLEKKYSRSASIKLILYLTPEGSPYYVNSAGSRTVLNGFQDPKTGLFITNTSINNQKSNQKISVQKQLYNRLCQFAISAIKDKVKQLQYMQKTDPTYGDTYKTPDQIQMELLDNLNDPSKFMADIKGQLRNMPDQPLPDLDTKILYSNSENGYATKRSDFKEPLHATYDEKETVESFLSVFFDNDNMSIFSWFMGAVFLNKPMHDTHISKIPIIYSRAGGVGKSTLMNVLCQGLLGDTYSVNVPSFDKYFVSNDKFGSASMPKKRLVVYDEAEFNGSNIKDEMHDFKGLNESVIKSFITNGNLYVEPKYENAKIEKYDNMHFILTNFMPQIDSERIDLLRRFVAIQLKATSMNEKARQLKYMTLEDMINFVHENGQAFINYFADVYLDDPDRFIDYQMNVNETLRSEETNVDEQKKQDQKIDDELKRLNVFELISVLCDKHNVNRTKILDDCRNSIPTKEYIDNSTVDVVKYTNKNNNGIHYIIDKKNHKAWLCLNQAKNFFFKYPKLIAIREDLMHLYPSEKKFHQLVIMIPMLFEYLYDFKNNIDNKNDNELKRLNAFELISVLCDKHNVDRAKILDDCKNAMPSQEYIDNSTSDIVKYTSKNNNDIHYVIDKKNHKAWLCLNRAKTFFSKYPKLIAICDDLKSLYLVEKRFHQRVIMIPMSIDTFN